MAADLRYALRALLRSPGFFAVASMTLCLGIAANAAIFSLFYQVLLRALPVPDPERLVVFHSEPPGLPGGTSSDNHETVFSYPLYLRLRDGAGLFRGVAARSGQAAQITLEGGAERGTAEVVSGNFFETLEVRAHAGRLIGASDDTVRGGNPVAVASFDFWKRRLGASYAAVNRKILVNGHPFVLVGVAPESFRGVLSGESPDLFIPISMKAALQQGWNGFDRPGSQWLTIIGRLAPGVTRERAMAALQPLFAAAIRDHVGQVAVRSEKARARLLAKRIDLRPAERGLNELERQWRRPLYVLLAMVFLLLLTGCANLANLMTARAVNRAREIAVRMALGAGRARLVRLLVAESLIVAFAGTVAGLLLAPVLTRALLQLMPEGNLGGWITAGVSLPVLGFCALLLGAVTLVSGLLPALRASGARTLALAERVQAGSAVHARTRKVLVAAQIALSLVLLAGAGLFGRSLANLLTHQPGFRAEHLLTFTMNAGMGGYEGTRGLEFYRQLRNRLAALPGVEAASFAEFGPLSHNEAMTNVMVEGYTPREEENMDCDTNAVAAGFLRTLGTRVVAGREFDERDTAAAPKVAVVNEAFVRRFFGGRGAVGRHMSIGAGVPLDIEIVGVMADMNALSLREAAKPTYFIPFEQAQSSLPRARSASFFVRAGAGFGSLPNAVRATVAQMDGTLPVYAMRSMEVQVADSVYTDRLIAALSTAFGVLAMVLTAVGLYGVIAYVVSRRGAEIGIRMALGAVRGDIVWLVMREVCLLTAAGTAVGLAGAAAAGRAVESQLFGVRGLDPAIFVAVPLMLAAVAMAAGCVPALRASRTDPMDALRHE